MAYEPTVWKNGDVITAEKLNKLENGVGGSGEEESNVVTVLFTYDRQDDQHKSVYRYSVPYSQLLQAFNDGKAIRGLLSDASTPSVATDAQYGDYDYPDSFIFVFFGYSSNGLTVYTIDIQETSSGTSILQVNQISYDQATN